MSEPRELRCYEYVTVEYDRVRDALRRDALGLFQRATASATPPLASVPTRTWRDG